MIGIITVGNDTFTNPTLFTLIKKLDDKGEGVALFNDKNQDFTPPNLKHIKYFDGPRGFQIPRKPANFINYLRLYRDVIKQLKANKIVNLIAVDPVGLILAGRIKRLYKAINIHYFSFEIFFSEEVKNNPVYSDLKKKEIFYSKFVSSILIQDEERKRNLIEENKISLKFNNWHLIPVAPAIKESEIKYDRAKYGLTENDIVYIHSGSVARWAGINQIIDAVEKGLPENTKLFIHSRSKFDASNDIHKRLLKLKASNPGLILHDEIFDDYDDYLSFLKIFNYGIVLYEPDGGIFTGKNIQDIGLASGKFSTYMAVGLPSLLFNCKTYHQIVKNHSIGAIVSSDNDLSHHIKSNSLKKLHKEDCIIFYSEVLDPVLSIGSFIAKELA
ncbi:MAG: hypothetical protein V4663_00490 [Bacteroidota bacterium]